MKEDLNQDPIPLKYRVHFVYYTTSLLNRLYLYLNYPDSCEYANCTYEYCTPII